MSKNRKANSIFFFSNCVGMTREYRLILGILIALSGVAWVVTVRQMGGMGFGWVTGSMTMGRPFSVTNLAVYVGLWGVMMVAMMFPAVAPVAGLFAGLTRQRTGRRRKVAPVWVFVSGYAVLWTLTGGVGYAADLGVQSLPGRFPVLQTHAAQIGGGLLIAAGAYQLTPLKNRCLDHCRSPFGFLMASWRDGYVGAFRMGLTHGGYCLACCWSLMMVMFVMGSMNLVWMGLLAIVIFLEKSLPSGVCFGRGVGVGLIALGGARAVGLLD